MGISSRRLTRAEVEQRQAFQQTAWAQRACAVTKDGRDFIATGKNWEAHHVVEARWLKMHKRPVWDSRNALRLRPDIHRKHTNRTGIIELAYLLDRNIDYAFQIMGPAAEDYLLRLYHGEDSRVQRASEVANKQMEDEIAALPPGTLWLPPHMRTRP